MYLIVKETTRTIGNCTSRLILGYKTTEESAKEAVADLNEQERKRKNNGMAFIDYYFEKVEEYQDEKKSMVENKSAIKMQSDFEDVLNRIGSYADGGYDSVDALLEDISNICIANVNGYDEDSDTWL